MANITNNTIFDDVFRTMVEKMPDLAVPLINEIFGTSYPEDIKIIQRRNDHQTKQGEIITDSQLLIAEKIYHLECQSTQDSEMVVRMIEYDFSIGLETTGKRREIPNVSSPFLYSVLERKQKNRKADHRSGGTRRRNLGIQSPGSVRWTLYKRRNLRETVIFPSALLYHEVREGRLENEENQELKGNAGRIQRNRRTSGERISGKRKRERIP